MTLKEKIHSTCSYLAKQSQAEAILIFGSIKNGSMWQESDIDLFIISKKSKDHTAFYFNRGGVLYHCNVCSPKSFKKHLKNPLRTAIQGLLLEADIYGKNTAWLKKEVIRIKKYPMEYRLLRIIERLEVIFDQIYKLRKFSHFHPHEKYTENPYIGFEKILEIESIDKGIYFGRSIFNSLLARDKKILSKLPVLTTQEHIKLLQKRSRPLVNKYLPLFINKLKKLDKKLSYHEISEATGLDMRLVFKEAEKRGMIQIIDLHSTTHGFPVEQETVIFQ